MSEDFHYWLLTLSDGSKLECEVAPPYGDSQVLSGDDPDPDVQERKGTLGRYVVSWLEK